MIFNPHPLPTHVDSTILAEFRACPRAFYFRFLENLVPWREGLEENSSLHTSFGSAVASAAESMRKAVYIDKVQDEDLLLAIGIIAAFDVFGLRFDHKFKNTRTLFKAIFLYQATWPIGKDTLQPVYLNGDTPMVEVPFQIPLEEKGLEEFSLCGTADNVVSYGGAIYNMDEKTCSQLGVTWAAKWDLHGQFTCYNWALQKLGLPVRGTIVRGICMTKEIQLIQVFSLRHPEMLQDWYQSKVSDLRLMKQYAEQNFWPGDFSEGCRLFLSCRYKKLCMAHGDAHVAALIDQEYVRMKWNPIERKLEPLNS